jgi:hypothetical protein
MLFNSIKNRRNRRFRKYCVEIASKCEPARVIPLSVDIYKYIKYGKVSIFDFDKGKYVTVEQEDIPEEEEIKGSNQPIPGKNLPADAPFAPIFPPK